MEANRAYDWVLKPQDAEVARRFVEHSLIPQEEKIREMAARGETLIIFFEAMPHMIEMLGARGPYDMKVMTRAEKNGLRGREPSAKSWLDRKEPGLIKIFAVVHMGTFLFHWASGHELYVEPGSLDEEREKSEVN